MKVIIKRINYEQLKQHLYAINALKVLETVVVVELFEIQMLHYKPPTMYPQYLLSLVHMLARIPADTTIFVHLKEEGNYIRLSAKLQQLPNRQEIATYIPISDLAQIEETLLECGFQLARRKYVKQVSYLFNSLKAKYDLYFLEDIQAYVRVTAPDAIKLSQALALIGYDMSQVEFE